MRRRMVSSALVCCPRLQRNAARDCGGVTLAVHPALCWGWFNPAPRRLIAAVHSATRSRKIAQPMRIKKQDVCRCTCATCQLYGDDENQVVHGQGGLAQHFVRSRSRSRGHDNMA